jgi:predicted HAD superfamily Cof-like phosphohydrolase
MNPIEKQVREFHEKFGLTVNDTPKMVNKKERRLRANLILEEAIEFITAMGFYPYQAPSGEIKLDDLTPFAPPDLIAAADAIGDLNYVVAGAAVTLGIDTEAVANEVHRSNMTKVWDDGTVKRRPEDGKILKPPTYSPVDLESVLDLKKAA